MWKKGYWGPVCFDSGLTNAGVLRSVIEINARMSMGMIAHDLCMYLAQFEVIAELHRVSLVVEEGFTYQTLQRHLTNAGLLWRPGMESGVIPLTSGSLCDTQAGGKRRRLPWFVASVGLHLRECQAACKRLEAMSTSGAVKVLFT